MYYNDPKYKSNKTIEFLKKIKSIDWSPYSPDLNSIENVWGLMARKIKQKDIMTQSHLIKAVKSAWEEIDQKVKENCIDSLHWRINDSISKNGDK